MSSPFRVFRKHQKVMMVVLVGLSMLSFVVCGSIQSAQDVSGPLLVALLAFAIGSITWLFGLGKQKSTEYGAYGLLIGACAGLLLAWNFSAPPAIRMKGGNISNDQLNEMQNRRNLASQFVYSVVARINEANPNARLQPINFGGADARSLAFGETLRREADRLGVVGSQETVTSFLKAITTPDGGGETLITSQIMQSVCREIGTSEQAVYDALLDEWRMLEVQQILSGGDLMPPETYWDAHQKLNVQQDMEIAVLPVADFVDESAQPSDSELTQFFGEYRENFPNQTSEGRPEPGRPGFYQPRRAQFAYVEGTADEYLDQVTVTPEEIDAEYVRRYPPRSEQGADTSIPGPSSSVPFGVPTTDPFLNGPGLPPVPSTPGESDGDESLIPDATMPPEGEASSDAEATESTDAADTPDAVDAESPSAETPATDGEASDVDPATTDEAAPTTPDPSDTAGESSDDSSCDDPATEAETESVVEAADAPADQTETSEGEPVVTETPVDPSADGAATEAEATAVTADTATTDVNETETAVEPAPFTLSESEDPPPPSLPRESRPVVVYPPPLTDELRAEIEEYLRLIKADALLQEELESFAIAFEGNIGRNVHAAPESDDYMSTADALEAARIMGTEEDNDTDSETFDFYFSQTPLLSSSELRDSEDHSFGTAVQATTTGNGQPIYNVMYQGFGDLFRPEVCESPTQSSAFDVAPPPPASRYVVWKIADIADYAPESLDDDREGMEKKVRDQVVEAWRQFQARGPVEQRAEELIAMAAAGSAEPFSTIFADTKTNGDDGLNVKTTETGFMSWYRTSSAAANPMQNAPPVLNSIPGLPDAPTGDAFMHTVFRQMEVGETRAVWNADYTHMFIVRLKSRIPATPEEWNVSRAAFLTSVPEAIRLGQLSQQFRQFGITPPPMLQLAQGQMVQHMANGVDLFKKYEVEFAEDVR